MPTLLHVDSSPRSASISSQLAGEFVQQWQRRNPAGAVIHHNTSREAIPYVSEAAVEAFFTPAGTLSEEQKRVLALSDRLVDELLDADVIVLGVPMWNLGIPASLKAWIDMIVREGRTFAFTRQGVRGLLPPGKRGYVFSARGGAYPEGTAAGVLDLQEPYLRAILGAIGLTDVRFVHADNQSCGPQAAADGVAHAEAAMAALLA